MLRAFLVTTAALLAAAAPTAAQERPTLRAALVRCSTGAAPADRVASFLGSMPAQEGTARMAMRFELQARRLTDFGWTTVPGAPGFGSWERSQPLRAGFVFSKRIDGLGAGLLYRALVRFRWYAADGTIQRREVRATRACRQPATER